MKVVLCTPTYTRPHPANLAAVEAAVGVLEDAGITHRIVYKIGSPYISHARSGMLRQALDTDADVFVFIDHDVSFRGEDLVKLLRTDGDVCAGTYRFKMEPESYMGTLRTHADFTPMVRPTDGAIRADWVPAGFLKVTRLAVRHFMRSYPELLYGDPDRYAVDLFNHGAYKGLWYGEDYAFSRRWNDCGGEIWLVPDLNIDHHSADAVYPGNFHHFLLKQPGGSNDGTRTDPACLPADPSRAAGG